jgi:long-chain acyl-CoA synthetase
LVQCLYYGGTFYLSRSFDPVQVIQQCQQIPNLILFVVPTMIEAILQVAPSEPLAIQALLSSGAKWSTESKRACTLLFGGAPLYEFYGSSEASYISYSNVYHDPPYSVGRPFSGVDVSVRDEQFQEVAMGTIGQLYVKSEMVFKGYYLLPEETSNVFHEGWLVLGDYGYIDVEGYLYITGRVRNCIVSGGMNVFPEEVEAVLQQMPEIAEVMVCGRAHPYWGEQIIAIIQWNTESPLSIEKIKNHCHLYLAPYKAPKDIITVQQFEYTSSGKISRKAMKPYVESVSL